MQVLSAESIDAVLDWDGVLGALHDAHLGSRPAGDSFFLGDPDYGLLSRGVILPGAGAGLKLASICPANGTKNPPRAAEDAVFIVIDEHTRAIAAILDGPEITRWKTAGDSAVAARKLSREDSAVLLVMGAGPIAAALADAYLHIRPSITRVLLWNRTASKLATLRARLESRGIDARVVDDLDAALREADIITSATSATTPLIKGALVRPGTHVDLVGGYRPDMQEADNALLAKARLFVDDRSTAACSGDILIPLSAGAIGESAIEGDLFDLCRDSGFHRPDSEITVYKNAGGAHLDLIVSQYVMAQARRKAEGVQAGQVLQVR